MPTRGVLYMVWGRDKDKRIQEVLARSIQSLYKHHPELKAVVKDLPPTSDFLDKATMFELSPFDETLFLDADTVVLDTLTFGFERAAQHGLACCVCEAPYARRYTKSIQGDVVEYNTGVLFFSKTDATRRLFARWAELAPVMDSSHLFLGPNGVVGEMPVADQASFAMAVHQMGFNPFVLPLNWNLRPRFQPRIYGPVKIWHEYTPPPKGLEDYNRETYTSKVIRFLNLA